MKGNLKLQVQDLLGPLRSMVALVNGKAIIPSLNNVLLEKKEGNKYLYLTTSDGETWLKMKVPIIIEGEEDIECSPFSCCIDAHKMRTSFDTLADMNIMANITFDDVKNTMTCNYGCGYFILPLLPSTDYPQVQTNIDKDSDKYKMFTTSIVALQSNISHTSYAVANDSLRPQLNGVHFDATKDGTLASVASDGHLLSKFVGEAKMYGEEGQSPTCGDGGFTIPTRPIGILSTLLSFASKEGGDGEEDGKDDKITITYDDRTIIISTRLFMMTTRVMEHRFPDVERVIPQDNNYEVEVERETFINALKRVSPLGNASSQLVVMKTNNMESSMLIMAEDLEYSTSAKETLPLSYIDREGESLEIGVAGNLLQMILRKMQGEYVTMKMKGESSPIIITPKDDMSHLVILMPMMIGKE